LKSATEERDQYKKELETARADAKKSRGELRKAEMTKRTDNVNRAKIYHRDITEAHSSFTGDSITPQFLHYNHLLIPKKYHGHTV
jgi:hypothetical protein